MTLEPKRKEKSYVHRNGYSRLHIGGRRHRVVHPASLIATSTIGERTTRGRLVRHRKTITRLARLVRARHLIVDEWPAPQSNDWRACHSLTTAQHPSDHESGDAATLLLPEGQFAGVGR